MYIKRLKAFNFKKFKTLDISFKENLNLIIGENESGKSTILQAIDLLLSGSRNKIETIGLEHLMNDEIIHQFFLDKKFVNLPELRIEIYFENVNDPEYYGINNSEKARDCGITMICEPREDLSKEISEILSQEGTNFPFEFYNINFYKFGGNPYLGFTRKFKHILIDHSSINNEYATNSYIKTLYTSSIEATEKHIHSNHYRILKTDFKNNVLKNINDKIPGKSYEFSLKNNSKNGLENDLTIVENNIDILHRGKGRQCFIKTEFALSKNENELNFILLEEPENHLSHLNMHNLIERINCSKNKQIFIATHSNIISSRLDLRNAIFVNAENNINAKLSGLDKKTAEFFIKAPNRNLLEFILSKKVILVEGDAEHILIPSMLIQPSVENAIWHGLLHKNERGFLKIYFKKLDENLLEVTIEDNGVGRKKAEELRSKTSLRKKSYGTEITKNRIETLNKTSELQTSFEIIDLYNENENAAGTKVLIKIPFQKTML